MTGIFGGPEKSYAKTFTFTLLSHLLLNNEAGALQNADCKGTQRTISG